MPNPIDHESLYDSIQLDGVRSPGFVTLSGHDRDQTWDVKEADGCGGARTTYKGEKIAQFSASFYLVKDPVLGLDEFAEWDLFAAIVRSSLAQNGKPKALPIYHPDLSANEIKSVCQASISGMAHDGKGGATVVVKFLEYRPPREGKAGLPVTANKVDPNADLKAEIPRLIAKAQEP
jgi:hypothetical protein